MSGPKGGHRSCLEFITTDKGVRHVLLCIDGPQQKLSVYLVKPFASDFGRAFRLTKLWPRGKSPAVYDVLLWGKQSSCECMGFLRWGHCRHLEALRYLQERGQLKGYLEKHPGRRSK